MGLIKDKIYDKSLFPGIYRDYSTKTVESYNGEEAVSLSEGRYKVRNIKEDGRIYKKLKPLLSVASEKREKWEQMTALQSMARNIHHSRSQQ